MSEYFNQIIYGVKSFITGMRLTLNHFNKKKDLVATLQYPHEKWPIPERDIGFEHSDYNLIRSRLHVDIDDCIACMQCERACPVDCIKIDSIKPPKDNDFDCGMTSNDTQKKMIVSRFTIDMSECMYCNLCVFPCPEECIYMVGGPNDKKHEIDYEFSQYQRDGMIFEFADATDEMIRDAGGDKWIEQRDVQVAKVQDGIELKGEIAVVEAVQVKPAAEDVPKVKPESKSVKKSSGQLEISSFNEISDKMCRGISKKAFTASKRAGHDTATILANVAQALNDAGKMSEEIKNILDGLMSVPADKDIVGDSSENSDSSEVSMPPDQQQNADVSVPKELDIKDLNLIEDKMKRGTAKKAFIAAKRSGEDKVDAVIRALSETGMMDESIEAIFLEFKSLDVSNSTESSENLAGKESQSSDQSVSDTEEDLVSKELPLFDIKELNVIEDKMARGMAKKIFTAGKRADKSRLEVISDIRTSLEGASKIDDSVKKILEDLEGSG